MAKTNTARIKITGLDELAKNTDKILNQTHRILGEAVLEAAEMIRQEAIKRAPEKTGTLKRGIVAKITWDKKKSKAFAAAYMDPAMNDVFAKYAKDGRRFYYPSSMEYGTKNTGRKNQRIFMGKAYKVKRRQVKGIIEKHIKAAIEGAVK